MGWTKAQYEAHQKKMGFHFDSNAPMLTAVTLNVEVKPSYDIAKLNKTERAYLEYLKCLNPRWIGVQNLTLKLADDTRYTPDFIAIDNLGVVHAREVKGFWRDDAKVKIKVAARMFPWILFTAAEKTKTGWKHTEFRP